jgi:hypothetical protein
MRSSQKSYTWSWPGDTNSQGLAQKYFSALHGALSSAVAGRFARKMFFDCVAKDRSTAQNVIKTLCADAENCLLLFHPFCNKYNERSKKDGVL